MAGESYQFKYQRVHTGGSAGMETGNHSSRGGTSLNLLPHKDNGVT